MLASSVPVRRATPLLRIAFEGAPSSDTPETLHIDAPWLGGTPFEELFPYATPAPAERGIKLYRSGGILVGYTSAPFVAPELATTTQDLYQRVLAACGSRHLFRIWNYIPRINETVSGLENYRAFCRGRSLAFESCLGGKFQPLLPAASAVGTRGENLEVIFVAGETSPRHFENPEQIPAYRYPPEHGPRAPSFARATAARDGSRPFTFISGTAAIKGHQTVAPGTLEAQLDCTLDNLRLISRVVGRGDHLGASHSVQRHFKIYLRHAADLAAVRTRLEGSLLKPSDTVTYLQAEICRAALNVEIEATLID
jgi:chorismate lyase / 3-hydroxybenzoate synthase